MACAAVISDSRAPLPKRDERRSCAARAKRALFNPAITNFALRTVVVVWVAQRDVTHLSSVHGVQGCVSASAADDEIWRHPALHLWQRRSSKSARSRAFG